MRALNVLAALTLADLRFRYGRGPLRRLKWLLDPFAAVGVYLLLVTFVLHRAEHAVGLSLACAVVAFQLVMATVGNAVDAVWSRAPIILNLGFNRTLIPISAAVTESVAFAGNFLLVVLMMAAYRVPPTLAALWTPVLVALTLLFAIACAFPMALVGVWYEELKPFALSFARALFFLAPGLVALNQVHGLTADLIKLNPLTGLFECYRSALLYGSTPPLWALAYPFGFAVLLLAIFVPIYRREEPHLAKLLG